MKLLIIDDDRFLVDFLCPTLVEVGYTVDVAATGEEGRMLALAQEYDGIIIDLMLPDRSGHEIVRELRQKGRSTPVLMLTGKKGAEDLVRGLDAGADDYVTKPFSLAELHARLRALLRRGGATRTEQVTFGGLVLDRLTQQVVHEFKQLRLTPREYRLLEYLLMRPERVVTRTELLEKVWKLQFDPQSNVVDVHIARLRSKLKHTGADVATVRGAGYMLVARSNA